MISQKAELHIDSSHDQWQDAIKREALFSGLVATHNIYYSFESDIVPAKICNIIKLRSMESLHHEQQVA